MDLKEQIMINQFILVTGCGGEPEARSLLQAGNWDYEAALSIFFQESTINPAASHLNFNHQMTPANTPATPPNFTESLLAFSKMSANDSNNDVTTNNRSNRNNIISASPLVLQPQPTQQNQQSTGQGSGGGKQIHSFKT